MRPGQVFKSVEHIDLSSLRSLGVQGLMLDVDNTIAPWKEDMDDGASAWIREAKKFGFHLVLISNNNERRVGHLACRLGVKHISNARKPSRRAFLQAAQSFSLAHHQWAVIGDQLFTDVLGGNRAGMHTILVNPLPHQQFWVMRLVWGIEQAALFLMGVRRQHVPLKPQHEQASRLFGTERER